MTRIIEMYISLMPVILAGILNMVWCKSHILSDLYIPLDGNKNFKDGKRIFGDNKTWKGFIGMIFWGSIATMIWGFICGGSEYLLNHNYMYVNYENTIIYNLIIGSLFGLAYALCELPNSFIKRRLDIVPGKNAKGIKGAVCIFFDQADSIFGCVLVLALVYKITISFYLLFVFLGAITHIVINILLFKVKLRRNMF